ncbi:MAG: hypothetical protein U1D30_24835 [Planctomycetota bacterium]
MDSPAPTNRQLLDRFLPIGAVIEEDLRQTIRHWAFVAWAAVGLLLTIVWFAIPKATPAPHAPVPAANAVPHHPAAGAVEAAPSPTASQLAGKLLRVHLLLWTSFVIALGASSISGEADSAPESILCRGISRWEYYLGKCFSRMLAVVGLFLLLTVPAIGVSCLRLENDLTWLGVWRSVSTVAMVLAGIAAISVAGSSWFRNPLAGVAVLWMLLYGLGIVTAVLDIEALSPLSMVEQLPDMLRGIAEESPRHRLVNGIGLAALISTVISIGAYSFRDA